MQHGERIVACFLDDLVAERQADGGRFGQLGDRSTARAAQDDVDDVVGARNAETAGQIGVGRFTLNLGRDLHGLQRVERAVAGGNDKAHAHGAFVVVATTLRSWPLIVRRTPPWAPATTDRVRLPGVSARTVIGTGCGRPPPPPPPVGRLTVVPPLRARVLPLSSCPEATN